VHDRLGRGGALACRCCRGRIRVGALARETLQRERHGAVDLGVRVLKQVCLVHDEPLELVVEVPLLLEWRLLVLVLQPGALVQALAAPRYEVLGRPVAVAEAVRGGDDDVLAPLWTVVGKQ
jgi:hypothetical protein